MIRVEITRSRVLIQGHAGYAPPGQDIVCAAVSVLAQTLGQTLGNLANEQIQYSIKPGAIDIRRKRPTKKGDLLVDAFFIGICGTADTYPDHVHICP